MWAEFKWVIENFGNMLLMVLCLFTLIGAFIELLVRLIPTRTPETAITRLGKKLGNLGGWLRSTGFFVKTVLDFIKFPNNLKK